MRILHSTRQIRRYSGRPSTFAAGDRVLLRLASNPSKTILTPPLAADRVIQSHSGIIAHSSIISRGPRAMVATNRGVEYRATFPSLDEYITKTARTVTPVYPLDAAALVAVLDVRPGDRVFEAGTGHGSLTLALAKAGAVVTTVEKKRSVAEAAVKIVAGFARGVFEAQVDFRVGTPDQHVEGVEVYDAAILDLQDPEEYFEVVAGGMKPDAVLGVWCPSITQIAKGLRVVMDKTRELVLERVLEFPPGSNGVGGALRRWDVRLARVRNAAEPVSLRDAENRQHLAVKKEAGVRSEMVCRPMVGDALTGGGFLGVYRKRSESEMIELHRKRRIMEEVKGQAMTEEKGLTEGQEVTGGTKVAEENEMTEEMEEISVEKVQDNEPEVTEEKGLEVTEEQNKDKEQPEEQEKRTEG